MSNILIFGDSISRGAFDLEKAGWTNRLNMFYWQDNFEKTGKYYDGLEFYIFGMDGDRTNEILKKFDFQVENFQWNFKKIIFAIGTNDSGFIKGEKWGNKKEFRKNLEELIEKSKKLVGNKNVYFLGLSKCIDELVIGDWESKRLSEFDQIIEKVAKENDCQFIPMQDLLQAEDLADGLHPNARGHKKIFERVRNFLEEK